MNKRKPQSHKSKEQLVWEAEEKRVGLIRKDFIEKTFMPLMEGITENIEEAQMLCESTKTAINQAWQMKAGEMPLSDLKLKEFLAKVKKPELVYKHLKVIECLEGKTIRDAMILLDSLFSEANRAVAMAIAKGKLSDYKENKDDNSTKSTVK